MYGLLILGLVAVGCKPGAGIGSGGEDGSWSTTAASGAWSYPYGDVYSAGERITSETGFLIAQTSDAIQITYETRADDLMGTSWDVQHDHDTTTFLRAGGQYTHRGRYVVYNEPGLYRMKLTPLHCEYLRSPFCAVAADWSSESAFEVAEDFAQKP